MKNMTVRIMTLIFLLISVRDIARAQILPGAESDPISSYAFCSPDSSLCNISGYPYVAIAYGTLDDHIVRYFGSGSIPCNVKSFGVDPAPGQTKTCSYMPLQSGIGRGVYFFVNRYSGTYLSASAATNGTMQVQLSYSPQAWVTGGVGNNNVVVELGGSSLTLDNTRANSAKANLLANGAAATSAGQLWTLLPQLDGSYVLQSSATGGVVAKPPPMLNQGDYALTQQQIYTGGSQFYRSLQEWVLQPAWDEAESASDVEYSDLEVPVGPPASHGGSYVAPTDGIYRILSGTLGLALDEGQANAGSSRFLTLNPGNSSLAQEWIVTNQPNGFITIVNASSGAALALDATLSNGGGPLFDIADLNQSSYFWSVSPAGEFGNTLSTPQNMLGVATSSSGTSTVGVLPPAQSGYDYAWIFQTVSQIPTGNYVIANANSGLNLVSTSPSTTVSPSLSQYQSPESWSIQPIANGFATITSNVSHGVLDCGGNNAPVAAKPSNQGPCQQWQINSNGDGTYTLANAGTGSPVASISSDSNSPGAQIVLTKWNSGSVSQSWLLKPVACGLLNSEQTMLVNDTIASCDGRFHLNMQGDGNLVLYGPAGSIYELQTNDNTDNHAIMQADGNLVIYGSTNVAKWSSGTQGHPGSYLAVTDTGDLIIYGPGGLKLWAKGTHY
jgi:hypothetical protein